MPVSFLFAFPLPLSVSLEFYCSCLCERHQSLFCILHAIHYFIANCHDLISLFLSVISEDLHGGMIPTFFPFFFSEVPCFYSCLQTAWLLSPTV